MANVVNPYETNTENNLVVTSYIDKSKRKQFYLQMANDYDFNSTGVKIKTYPFQYSESFGDEYVFITNSDMSQFDLKDKNKYFGTSSDILNNDETYYNFYRIIDSDGNIYPLEAYSYPTVTATINDIYNTNQTQYNAHEFNRYFIDNMKKTFSTVGPESFTGVFLIVTALSRIFFKDIQSLKSDHYIYDALKETIYEQESSGYYFFIRVNRNNFINIKNCGIKLEEYFTSIGLDPNIGISIDEWETYMDSICDFLAQYSEDTFPRVRDFENNTILPDIKSSTDVASGSGIFSDYHINDQGYDPEYNAIEIIFSSGELTYCVDFEIEDDGEKKNLYLLYETL